MKHTLGTAAKATGVSKSTIYRAVKSGKLSGTRNEDGEYEIDPAELHRVYEPVAQRANTGEMTQDATPDETPHDTSNTDFSLWLREKLDATERELKQTRDELSGVTVDLLDTKERLNEHREAARLLEYKSTEHEQQINDAKRQAEEWKNALAERQAEIEQARAEAALLADKVEQEASKKAEAEAAARALQSRGLIARIFNQRPKSITAG